MIHVTITPKNGETIDFDTHGLLLAAESDEGVRCVKIKEALGAGDLLAILGAAAKMAQDELNKLEELLGDDADNNKEEN